jgi:hypothetical protein
MHPRLPCQKGEIHLWDRLQDTLARVPPGEFIMLGGDLYGHVGSGSDGIHGDFGFGKTNKEDERILEFCEALELVLGNTLFTKRKGIGLHNQ